MFLVYAGGLLEANARIAYGEPPETTIFFARCLIATGAAFLIPLILATFLKYCEQIGLEQIAGWVWYVVGFVFLVPVVVVPLAASIQGAASAAAAGRVTVAFFYRDVLAVLAASCVMATGFSMAMLRSARTALEKTVFHSTAVAAGIPAVVLIFATSRADGADMLGEILLSLAIAAGVVPGIVLLYFAVKRNFLEYGAQRNLMYALPATFLAILYLALVRRVGQWLEPVVPPEATASVLLFVLIFLFEPLERLIGPLLQKRFQERVAEVQKLNVELSETARQGSVALLLSEAERRVREAFGLAAVRITVPLDPARTPLQSPGRLGHVVQLPLTQGSQIVGALEVASTGSYLTGETTATLQLVADQLPSMIDLARLIEQKVGLERELAERERLAALGQMAANVSHNLRNPLSSMKTVLQVQLENPEMPVDIRRDCALVVDEIDRMSTKLTQLLRYAKPSVSGERVAAALLARQTAVLFRHDAERRNVRLEFEQPTGEVYALASEDGLGDVLSNLIVNAIEAQPNGGRVRVSLVPVGARLEILVEDDGPGIPPDVRAKIFQPYFTTKPTGTGLGLSIVARRVDEMGGTLSCESPLGNGKGTRFRLSVPLAPDPPADSSSGSSGAGAGAAAGPKVARDSREVEGDGARGDGVMQRSDPRKFVP